MEEKDKGYDDALINEIIAVLETRDIEVSDFNKIQSAIKQHGYYDQDEVEWDDVENYISWECDAWERQKLLEMMGCDEQDQPHKLLQDVGIGTLDDEFRMELLLKMYKSTCSITELENMIRASHVEKLGNVVL